MKKYLWIMLFLTTTAKADLVTIKIQGMSCGLCAESLEAKLKKNASVNSVVVDLDSFEVRVVTKDKLDVSDEFLKQTLKESGYGVKEIKR